MSWDGNNYDPRKRSKKKPITEKQLELLIKLDRSTPEESLKRLTSQEASERIQAIFDALDRAR